MNPDEIPLWFAIPASIVLCIAWRRQVVLERRAHYLTNHANGGDDE